MRHVSKEVFQLNETSARRLSTCCITFQITYVNVRDNEIMSLYPGRPFSDGVYMSIPCVFLSASEVVNSSSSLLCPLLMILK